MALSPPFASRELNGETLVGELGVLHEARVPQRALEECALAVKGMVPGRPQEVAAVARAQAARHQAAPALASMLTQWAARVRTDDDARALADHLVRLATAAALLGAMRRGALRLSARRGRP